tara:strand:- start:211 stop:1083 length:873 start_codon:yes stop_codon:yes gene_type:complete
VACIGSWRDVVGNMYFQLKDSGLYEKIREVRCVVLGDLDEFMDLIHHDEKFKIIFTSNEDQYLLSNWHNQKESLDIFSLLEKNTNTNTFSASDICENIRNRFWKEQIEIPENRCVHNEEIILTRLHEDSQEEDFYALYLHSKGVKRSITHPDIYPHITDWVDYLLYFNLYHHGFCIESLDTADVVGVNLNQSYIPRCGRPLRFRFGGNFWWSKSEYIRKLTPALDLSYGGPELWISRSMEGILFSIWNSNIDHYTSPYPSCSYRNRGFNCKRVFVSGTSLESPIFQIRNE